MSTRKVLKNGGKAHIRSGVVSVCYCCQCHFLHLTGLSQTRLTEAHKPGTTTDDTGGVCRAAMLQRLQGHGVMGPFQLCMHSRMWLVSHVFAHLLKCCCGGVVANKTFGCCDMMLSLAESVVQNRAVEGLKRFTYHRHTNLTT